MIRNSGFRLSEKIMLKISSYGWRRPRSGGAQALPLQPHLDG
jgi:hypothetical protein